MRVFLKLILLMIVFCLSFSAVLYFSCTGECYYIFDEIEVYRDGSVFSFIDDVSNNVFYKSRNKSV